ncbi:hypothetical protein B0H19DRAFT_957019 [Mycena capillaripes]|nr:hypothetical protein B0H19DRAFT_957019 [Mycena capillaripes]
MRVHHGAVDHEMITAGRPPDVMQHMRNVLSGMGVDVQVEGDFKYRCIRPAKRRDRRDVFEAAVSNGVVYGSHAEDVGDEVRFSVELTRLDRLKDMYSLDIRRLKGNLKSYKFLYDTLRM